MRPKKTLAYVIAAFACTAPAGAMTTGAPPPAEAVVEQGVTTERAPATRPASVERKKDAAHGHEHGRADEKEGSRRLSTGKKDE